MSLENNNNNISREDLEENDIALNLYQVQRQTKIMMMTMKKTKI